MTFYHKKITKLLCTTLLCATTFLSLCLTPVTVNAESIEDRIARHRAVPIESNEIENWPTGPVVSADSAILMDADTGTILYEKNIHAKQYPASTTKILTCLIISEQCGLDEMVTFSKDAVFDTPRDSNHIAMDVGQKLSVEDCLNAILIRSANEVCFACAEHITGTNWQDFANIMNKRAAELGCVDSHFVNPNGLPDDDHYTSAYDLATIGRAFFDNELLCQISISPRLHILATEDNPNEKIENSKNEFLPGKKYAYEYLVGTKTGYTDTARHSLVTCAEKDGMKLICVVLNDESPYQYEDTLTLFNYGFSNFTKVNISQTETKYNIEDTGLFYSGYEIFGKTQPLLALNKQDSIILPKNLEFSQVTSQISYETTKENQAALITYSYGDIVLGTASIDLLSSNESFSFDEPVVTPSPEPEKKGTDYYVYIPTGIIAGSVFGILVVIFILLFIRKRHSSGPEFSYSQRSYRNNRRDWKRRRRHSRKWK